MNRSLTLCLLAGLVTSTGVIAAPEELRPLTLATVPPASESVPHLLSTGAVSQGAEPTILVDKFGRGILIGDHTGVYRSVDGGATWVSVTPLYIPGTVSVDSLVSFSGGISDGWALAQDDAGKIYASTTDGFIINVATSLDGGATWEATPSTLFAEAGAVADRPWLAARGDGEVFVIWNEGGLYENCASSTDGALTFLDRTRLGAELPIGGLPAWDATGAMVFAGNGGVPLGAATLYRLESSCRGGSQEISLAPQGAQLSTQVAADAEGIFTAIPTLTNQQMTIAGYSSFAAVWPKTLSISPAALQANVFGAIAKRPGEIAVAWYGTDTSGDFQRPGFSGEWNVYLARVRDFWSATPTVTVERVTTVPNHVGDICFQGVGCAANADRDLLDYFQISYDIEGNVHLAYGHDGATIFPEVRYARVTAISP